MFFLSVKATWKMDTKPDELENNATESTEIHFDNEQIHWLVNINLAWT